MALKAFEQDSFLEHPDLNKTKPGVPACQTCAMLKKMEKKKGAEPFESIYLQFKIYKLISCYINIIGWWAGVRYIDAKTESCWSSDSPCWQAKTDTKELSCASPIRDRQKAKLASSKQAEIWNILKLRQPLKFVLDSGCCFKIFWRIVIF